jgi:hypothetical protein
MLLALGLAAAEVGACEQVQPALPSGDQPGGVGTAGPAQVATITEAGLTPSTLTPDEAAAVATAMERSFRPDSGPVEESPEPSPSPPKSQP